MRLAEQHATAVVRTREEPLRTKEPGLCARDIAEGGEGVRHGEPAPAGKLAAEMLVPDLAARREELGGALQIAGPFLGEPPRDEDAALARCVIGRAEAIVNGTEELSRLRQVAAAGERQREVV